MYFGASVSANIRFSSCMIKYFKRQYCKLTAINMSNKLGQEKSPYLLQHQHNPVHWLPWNEETLVMAKDLGKPIFLSSGYSTCHWCHVMERESFENQNIANIMNQHFVNIKLDREEHPDIDRIYMTFIQAMSGSGGWPMSVWLTPELKPFYGGTYFPPDDRYFGRPGFRALLESIAEQWDENKDKCIESGNKIVQVLQKSTVLPVGSEVPPALTIGSRCNSQLARSYEPAYGGFSEQPKFPQPVNLQFLIHYAKYESNCFAMAEKTLKEMRKGGIYDHLGNGFCRYSTDKKWHVPHFEKMLYDEAQLTTVYLNAYLHSKDEFYADVAKEVLKYVSRDMSIPEGGFYSAEDADSLPTGTCTEKKEGAFYVWEKFEIDEILGETKLSNSSKSASDLFCARYGVKEDGNVNPQQDPHDELKKKNVIFEAKDYESLAKEFAIPVEEVKSVLEESCEKLFNWRNENKPRPHLDNKFIASWNGLMLSAFAYAGYVLSNEEYLNRALKSAQFIESQLLRDSDLLRTCYTNGVGKGGSLTNLGSPIYACVDDFANVISGLLDLFQATGIGKWLKLAIKLQSKQNGLFWDSDTPGGYFTTRITDKNAIIRMKDDDDGAEPSSNSTSLINLLRLELLFPQQYSTFIDQLLLQFSDRLSKVPITLPLMSAALLSYESGVGRYFVIGRNLSSSNNNPLIQALKSKLLPIGSLVCPVDLVDGQNVSLLKTTVPLIGESVTKYEKETAGSDEILIFAKKTNTEETVIKSAEELLAFFSK